MGEDEHKEFVKSMLKKAKKNELTPQDHMGVFPTKKDPPTEPYVSPSPKEKSTKAEPFIPKADKDSIKSAEEFIKRVKEKIK